VPGLSENVRVISVLGRFLEHSRIVAFENGGDPEYWIGSADLMHRNLDRRVEAMVRLAAAEHKQELAALFDLGFDDDTAAWRLQPDGRWIAHRKDADGRPLRDLHETLIDRKQRRRVAA
jgi:polyphosphate kinase